MNCPITRVWNLLVFHVSFILTLPHVWPQTLFMTFLKEWFLLNLLLVWMYWLKKYWSLVALIGTISSFKFKGIDKTNRLIPLLSILKPKKLLAVMHDNWTLIRFLPLMTGHRVQHKKPAWRILTDLQDIVELVVCPVHTEDFIAYLDFKILEHRTGFQEVFSLSWP